MWQDALRVCKEYIPHKLQALQDEYEATMVKNSTRGAETLIQQAREWESNGEYQRAVECYVKVTPKVTQDVTILERCWVKVSLCSDHYAMTITLVTRLENQEPS